MVLKLFKDLDYLHYHYLLAEIELLLSAEENAILQQNQVPNLTKISSVSFLFIVLKPQDWMKFVINLIHG